jgi:2-amino-4-hydroxy-6-hydroxymethyldihydropteridine diphosphokinase
MSRARRNKKIEVALSLGSNLGDRLQYLITARKALSVLPDTQLTAYSSIFETDPVDVLEKWQHLAYFNAVVILETSLETFAFSNAVHDIEDRLGRKRCAGKINAPREIDIDIIYFGDHISQTPTLRLPHPEWHRRRFVCAPLAQLRPDLIITGQTDPVSLILKNLPSTPGARIADEQWPTFCDV